MKNRLNNILSIIILMFVLFSFTNFVGCKSDNVESTPNIKGQWWNPEDIVEEIDDSKGNFKGVFKTQNGDPVKKVKIVIRSDEKDYTATTDKKGNFEFKDIKTGYYDIYLFDKNGKETLTDMFFILNDGDTIIGTITTDLSAKK